MSARHRQEVFNFLPAPLPQERGVITAPESIVTSGPDQARQTPDLVARFHRIRMAIKGEVSEPPHATGTAMQIRPPTLQTLSVLAETASRLDLPARRQTQWTQVPREP